MTIELDLAIAREEALLATQRIRAAERTAAEATDRMHTLEKELERAERRNRDLQRYLGKREKLIYALVAFPSLMRGGTL